MAKRKAPKRRRSRKTINLTGIAEAVVQANFATEGLFGTSALQFVTGRIPKGDDRGSLTVTGWELISSMFNDNNAGNISQTWVDRGGLNAVVKHNLNESGGGARMVGGLVLTPVAFRIGKRVLSKQRNMINKLLRNSGVSV